jgi:hypothetical protein
MKPAVKVLGMAALAGGALRVADSLVTGVSSTSTLALLYLLTDFLLLLGIGGIYWSRRGRLGAVGTIGAATFVAGIVLVRVSAFGALGASGYMLGATVAVIGLAVLSAETLIRRSGAYRSAALWLLAWRWVWQEPSVSCRVRWPS